MAEWPRDFRAARIGHDAISAELVAAFLHRQERARPAFLALRQRVKLGDGGHIGIGRALAVRCLVEHFGQAVIGLRANHDGNRRRARHNLLSLGLRDAARDCDQRCLTRLVARLHQAANVRIDLLSRLFADVAGVEDDEIGLLALRRGRYAAFAQQFGHALAIIDVHLAAEAFDPVGFGGRGGFHEARAFSADGRRFQSAAGSGTLSGRD